MSATDEIRITQEMRDELTARCAEWVAIAASTGATDGAAVRESVAALYQFLELAPPTIVFCQSPWQLAAARAVLTAGTARSSMEESLTQSPHREAMRGAVSSNDSRLLWERLWQVLEEQVPAQMRAKLRAAREEEESYIKSMGSSLWLKNMTRHIPFLSREDDPPKPGLFGWTSLSNKIQEMQQRLTAELEGAIAARLGGDSEIFALKSVYEPSFNSQLGQRLDSRGAQISAQVTLQNAELILPEMMNIIEDLRGERVFQLGWAALRGRLTEQYELMWPTGSAERFNAWLAAVQAAHELWYGAWTIGWLPFFQFLHERFDWLPFGPTNLKRMKVLLELARTTACCLICRDICLVCERPLVLKTDETGRLHGEDGPALAYGDGFKLYSWHGVSVSDWVIKRPEYITVDKISLELNAEIRRVMIERYGTARYVQDSLCEIVDKDECGVLYRRPLPGDEPLVMVKVRNSTPEPDGTYKEYFLRVPPTMRTAREAVAWTFAMDSAEYKPKHES